MYDALMVVVAIIGLGGVIFVHELGHFIAAKACGLTVSTFSLGFGHGVLRFDTKKTRYQIGWIPFGGFVGLVGESEKEESRKEELDRLLARRPDKQRESLSQPEGFYTNAVGWKQLIVSISGPIASLLLTVAILFGIFATYGDVRPAEPLKINLVMNGSPAQKAGLQDGDEILEVAGRAPATFRELTLALMFSEGDPVPFRIQRGDTQMEYQITPRAGGQGDIAEGRLYEIGVVLEGQRMEAVSVGLIEAFVLANRETVDLIYHGILSVKLFVTGQVPITSGKGPVGITHIGKQYVEGGLLVFLSFLAIMSVSVGFVMNLLPIPPLDGGNSLYALWKWIVGHPPKPAVRYTLSSVGTVMLLGLMVIITINDIGVAMA